MDDSSMHSISTEHGLDSPQGGGGGEDRASAPQAGPHDSIALRVARWLRLSPAAPSAYEQVSGSTRNSLFVIEGEGDDDDGGDDDEEEQEDGAGLQMVDMDP